VLVTGGLGGLLISIAFEGPGARREGLCIQLAPGSTEARKGQRERAGGCGSGCGVMGPDVR